MSGPAVPSIPGLSSSAPRPASVALSPERVFLATNGATASPLHRPMPAIAILPTNANTDMRPQQPSLALHKAEVHEKTLATLSSISALPRAAMKASSAHDELTKSIRTTLSNVDYALDRTISNLNKMEGMTDELNAKMGDMKNAFKISVDKTLDMLTI
ncbi:hypothetical protein SeMB42_g07064 [Synchytrium endobioticum]|uniref:BLOC-1-related complex subunit 7 n=1 Tax=Synchytrium endobioticum TaxID=286115 RepID=A0A507C4J9_9FUNG|nr:hypothetical protein SeMB42_g07064 [Synchytrium endobioticum]TPX42803.1 hypothetical protein SeLEV6574_g05394 [Synchytrium endobioticum]